MGIGLNRLRDFVFAIQAAQELLMGKNIALVLISFRDYALT